jgi:hypothetical protein
MVLFIAGQSESLFRNPAILAWYECLQVSREAGIAGRVKKLGINGFCWKSQVDGISRRLNT